MTASASALPNPDDAPVMNQTRSVLRMALYSSLANFSHVRIGRGKF
jgi:hypothetical protein